MLSFELIVTHDKQKQFCHWFCSSEYNIEYTLEYLCNYNSYITCNDLPKNTTALFQNSFKLTEAVT